MKQEIIGKVQAAGIVGAGGAGFPTYAKLDAQVDRALGNGASCEPLLKSDPYIMERHPELILRGLSLVMESTGADHGTICLKGKYHQAMREMRRYAGRGDFKNIDVFDLADYYPAGDEQVLVYEVMRRVVPEGGIPLQVGAVVSNVESLLNIARAVDLGEPVTERYLTVTGEVARHFIMKVPIGTAIGEVISLAGGTTTSEFRVLLGGPMMGEVVSDLSTPVTKTTSGVILLSADHNVVTGKMNDPVRMRHITKVVCCQCTRCTDLCPRNLLGHSLEPHKIMRQLGSLFEASREIMSDALICSECGICEKYACPMMISPREVNAQLKRELLNEGVKRSPRKDTYRPSAFREMRKIPTSRLMERLQVRQYDDAPDLFSEEMHIMKVEIPLKQHIGARAVPVVDVGDRVQKGDLIGEIPEKALGARVHASIDGVVASVGERIVVQSQ